MKENHDIDLTIKNVNQIIFKMAKISELHKKINFFTGSIGEQTSSREKVILQELRNLKKELIAFIC